MSVCGFVCLFDRLVLFLFLVVVVLDLVWFGFGLSFSFHPLLLLNPHQHGRLTSAESLNSVPHGPLAVRIGEVTSVLFEQGKSWNFQLVKGGCTAAGYKNYLYY